MRVHLGPGKRPKAGTLAAASLLEISDLGEVTQILRACFLLSEMETVIQATS